MGKRVMLCANRDFVLYNFRFELLQRLLDEGNEVLICLPYGPKVDLMTAIGCVFIPLKVEGRGTNPFKDVMLLRAFRSIFKKYKPDMVLTYTTKVCIYAGIVAGQMKIPYLENISGLGTAVETKNVLQPLMIALYRMAVRRAQAVFFQNEANEKFFADHGIICMKSIRIPGSGVNLERWKFIDYPRGEKSYFLFVARIIKEKGMQDQVVLISLKYDILDYIEQKYPEMQTGFLAFISMGEIENTPFDYLALEEEIATDETIEAVHSKGKKLIVWTVNEEDDISYFMTTDADAIITDSVKLSGEIKDRLTKRSPVEIILQKLWASTL